MSELEPVDEQRPENVESAGQRLRRARERAGWTPERLAGELCLSVDRLRALEADEHAGFGGVVFVRGYLRRAATVLNLPPAELVAAYEAASGTRPADIMPQLTPGEPPGRARPAWLGPAAGLGVAAAAIAVTWWAMRPAEEPVPLAESPPPAPAEEFALPAAEIAAEITTDVSAAAPDGGAPLASSVSADATEVVEPAATDRDATVVPVDEPAAGQLALPVTVELRLEFTEDCWVEISDAHERRLAYRLYRAGDLARLRGVAPVAVFLGNAEGVRLTVDDAPVAVRQAAGRDGTARLSVGGGTG